MDRIDDALQRAYSVGHPALVPPPSTQAPLGRPVPRAEPPRDEDALDLRRLILVLFKRKWQIFVVAVFVVIPVTVSTVLAERLYRSSALVQVDPEPVQVLPYREIDLPSLSPNYEMFMRSQEQILRGPTLVLRIAESLQAKREAPAVQVEAPNLWERLSIQRLENTQIFRLSYIAPDPQVAAAVANVFAEEYIKLNFESRQQTRQRARELLERELESLEQRVQVSEKDLVAYAQRNNITTADAGQSLVEQKLGALATQLTDAEAEIFVARSRAGALDRASVSEFPVGLVTPVISGLVSKLAGLEHEMTALRASFGENWPAVRQKRSEIALVQEQLDREKGAALAQAREQAQLDLNAAENKRKMLAGSMAEQQVLANKLQNATIQYNIIRREVETSQKMYEGLLARLGQTSVTSGMEFGGFHVVEPARPSSEVDSPRVVWNLSLASVLGLALGICIAFVRDFWDTSVASVEEVEEITDLPVLGTLPLVQARDGSNHRFPVGNRVARDLVRLPGVVKGFLGRPAATPAEPGHTLFVPGSGDGAGGSARKSDTGGTPKSTVDAVSPRIPTRRFAADRLAEEGIRNVCASILLSRSGRPPRVFMVTSAAPGEGKTTMVSELGYALAESGAGTLLVECDLRRPGFSSIFNVKKEGGLSLFLSGHVGPTPTINGTDNSNLFVVGAGPTAPNPPALLASDKMASFLREMMLSFRFVILDTPPVLPMADARVLAPMVEGVVLVVRAGQVPKPMVRRAFSLLAATGANVLGAVLNGADAGARGYPYYRYYHEYYQPSNPGGDGA